MELKRYHSFCLCSLGGRFPAQATPVSEPFAPLVLLVNRPPLRSRGIFAVTCVDEALQGEGCCALLSAERQAAPDWLRAFVAAHGATVLNTAFPRAFDVLLHKRPETGLRAVIVGLGDVGGSLLTALKLLGAEFSELSVYDANEAQCLRYEAELNQVLSLQDTPLPRVTLADRATLFDCDVFLFTASRGVPPVGAEQTDVRMAQFARNRALLREYAVLARQARFCGLFCQVSDPVDALSRVAFLESNRNAAGELDLQGLLPEQLRGFGLGVMAARAAYYAAREGIDFSDGRVYGPHGRGLVVANAPLAYDAELSGQLTALTVQANLEIRALGFKPYLAPALSSAAVSLLRLLRSQPYYAAVPMGSAFFGCTCRQTAHGLLTAREPLHPALYARICETHAALEAFCYD